MICIPPPYDRVAHIEQFNEYLVRAVVKGECSTGSGTLVDYRTKVAIDQVAAAYPNPDPALIRAARVESAKEINGTQRAEDRAWWRAPLGVAYSTWPQTPFSDSVKNAFDHVLTFVNSTWAPEELRYTRESLESAVAAGTAARRRSRQTLIVGLLSSMIDQIAVIPDWHVGHDTDEESKKRFVRRTRTALQYLVKFVEEPESHEFEIAARNLTNAAHDSSLVSTRGRDLEVIVEHLRLILEALERRRGR